MPTVSEVDSNIIVPMDVVANWLADSHTQQRVVALANNSLAEVETFLNSDTSLRIPRQPADRTNGFVAWLSRYEVNLKTGPTVSLPGYHAMRSTN
jgi:hypothetical protein